MEDKNFWIYKYLCECLKILKLIEYIEYNDIIFNLIRICFISMLTRSWAIIILNIQIKDMFLRANAVEWQEKSEFLFVLKNNVCI